MFADDYNNRNSNRKPRGPASPIKVHFSNDFDFLNSSWNNIEQIEAKSKWNLSNTKCSKVVKGGKSETQF